VVFFAVLWLVLFIHELDFKNYFAIQVLIQPFEDSKDRHFPLQCGGNVATCRLFLA
jgi:hypothetical protein